ncbi:hypothetical protein H6G76_24175 [Nostoc sp. FACHB-152]|uniref:hypothetical protein n=1 Tax=unclassified Nostoc TaxID=2593658 RepID=UPI0016856DAF|nr:MULTISPECIES: hypothetical protein [unclassified Nostoc]MBD2450201.1 hypothetical protein [Nostoc sp. FACHB-152]MBD2469024.1 hypothetical protein [Nostoc sp. FACHB-145]
MSSGSSGRYQSRLFNYVHQQSRRLTQRWEQTFRQVQVATKWGVEALVYPVYLILQSAESKVKTLYTKEPEPRLKLQPNDTNCPPETIPTTDTPIQRVLEAVQNLPSEEISTPVKKSTLLTSVGKWLRIPFQHSPTNDLSLPQSLTISDNSLLGYLPAVRGIATSLGDRNLVLVSSDNQILDVLTPQQQAKLRDRIISEVANYWHSQQVIEAQTQSDLLPEINRLLSKLTGEPISNIPALPAGVSAESLKAGKILEILDAVIAKFEQNTLVPVQQRSHEIIQFTQTQLNIFLYGKEQLNNKGDIAVTPDGLETQTLNFQALIEAALNYFFGVGKEKKLHSANSKSQYLHPKNYQALPKNRKLRNQNVTAEPWLTWNDLFGNSQAVADNTIKLTSEQIPTLSPSPLIKPYPQQKIKIPQPKPGAGLVKRKKQNRNLSQSQKTSGKVATRQQSEINQHQSHNHQVEAQPDWIEITATAIGYEQHFLEKILVWLDRAMLWLEEILVKAVKLLKRLWRGKQ